MTCARVTLLNGLLACLLFSETRSTNVGSECTTSICTAQKGFINYSRSRTRQTQWTLRSDGGRFTNFVLIVRDIEARLPYSHAQLRIVQHRYGFPQTYDIRDNLARLYVFEETNEVTISLYRPDLLRFRLEFYVGCEVEEDINITIDKQASSLSEPAVASRSLIHDIFSYNQNARTTRNSEERKCWIVIPSIREEIERTAVEKYWISLGYIIPERTRTVEVQQTFLSIKNVSLPSNTTNVRALDMLTGNTLISVDEGNDLGAAVLRKSNVTTLLYKPDYSVSTLILLELSCGSNEDCEESDFTFVANAIDQKDLDCVEREQKCRYNIGNRDFNCTDTVFDLPALIVLDLDTENNPFISNCSAFGLFLENILDDNEVLEELKEEEEEGSGLYEDDLTGRIGSTKAQKIYRRKFGTCKNYQGYCGNPCGNFESTHCKKFCLVIKVWNMCHDLSVFS